MERYIVKYLLEHTTDPKKKRFLDYMKVKLDMRLWSMGNHIPWSFDNSINLKQWQERQRNNVSFLRRVKRYIRSKFVKKKQIQTKNTVICINESEYIYKVLCLLPYLSYEVLSSFTKYGIKVVFLLDILKNEKSNISILQKWFDGLEFLSFNQLLTESKYSELDFMFRKVVEETKQEKFDALLVGTSELFYEKFFIDVFKEINKPSITILHGLPGIYSLTTESRADYILVYGNQIKKNFELCGYDSSRVLVGGNFKLKVNKDINATVLRSSLENVLVLTTSTYVEHQHEWEWEKFPAQDRSLLVTYLYSIENVLKKCGCKQARLRPHPNTSRDWFVDYVDMNFFELDRDDLTTSLSRSTLCIGPTSTTFFEAIMNGVNYLVYEPGDGKKTLTNASLVPPFDGSDRRLNIAFSESQLESMINCSYHLDKSLFDDYMQPFDVNILGNIIEKHRIK